MSRPADQHRQFVQSLAASTRREAANDARYARDPADGAKAAHVREAGIEPARRVLHGALQSRLLSWADRYRWVGGMVAIGMPLGLVWLGSRLFV